VWVVMAEIPSYFEAEAIKAQAVAARTYILYRLHRTVVHRAHPNADVCDDFRCCLAAHSLQSAINRWGDTAVVRRHYRTIQDAVEATAGYVLKHNGRLIDALFHSSSPGKTENVRYVWGSSRPYLMPVFSPEKRPIQTRTLAPRAILASTLSGRYTIVPGARPLGEIITTGGGRVRYIYIYGNRVSATLLRRHHNFRSTNFEVSMGTDGMLNFAITGHGHGAGMSQYGANHFARNGYSWRQIVLHYYTATNLVRLEQR